jgi:ribosomal protein S18 acetylase RimI-like enzyme
MLMSLTVRPARPEEYAAIGALTVAAYRADDQLTEAYEPVLVDVAGRAGHGTQLAAVDEGTGEVVGGALFVLPGSAYAELCRPDEVEFRTLAVAPAAWGRRVGEALARACVERAAEAGAHAVVISVRDFAQPAKRLYARLGFRPLPQRDWSPAPGVRLEAYRLALPVGSAAYRVD